MDLFIVIMLVSTIYGVRLHNYIPELHFPIRQYSFILFAHSNHFFSQIYSFGCHWLDWTLQSVRYFTFGIFFVGEGCLLLLCSLMPRLSIPRWTAFIVGPFVWLFSWMESFFFILVVIFQSFWYRSRDKIWPHLIFI